LVHCLRALPVTIMVVLIVVGCGVCWSGCKARRVTLGCYGFLHVLF
jgi:hypothetical protein